MSDVWSLVASSLSGSQPGHRRGGWGLAVSRYAVLVGKDWDEVEGTKQSRTG